MISRVSIVCLVIALLALAGLQYHWIGQISVAERQRLEASVRDSSSRFAADFNAEIRALTNGLDLRGGEPYASDLAVRYRGWVETAANPELLGTLYLIRSTPTGAPNVFFVDLQNESLQFIDWPAALLPVQNYLRREPGPHILPHIDGTIAQLIPLSGRPQDPQHGRPGPGFDRGPGRDGDRGGEADPVGGAARHGGPQTPQTSGPAASDRSDAWLIVELDKSAITKQVFPALVARDFPMTGDQDYRVAIISVPDSRTVFSTGKSWTPEDLASPDYSVDLIGVSGLNGGGPRGGPPRGGRGGGGPPQSSYIGQGMRLLVKHEAGSLETAVSHLRRRNLAISFGILMVLGLGAGVVIISGQRARTLGKLQMEFAAGVSHELRTPLAVIQSAAHNLRSGVVRDREGIEEYAMIVQKEARRLSNMVEQVMTYAETQSGRKRYDIAPVDLNAVVDRALQNMAIPLSDAGASVENRIDPQLPPAMADEVALTQCIQNLLSNALKYGSANNAVQIEIESGVDRQAGKICVRVIDHGPGVPVMDEKHLFDPFHRGSNAATNTPGNGLGLHLVRRIMESQQGTVAYHRILNGGACFTLTLPAVGTAV